jgi:ABC-2 type transport system ATP-binding protein
MSRRSTVVTDAVLRAEGLVKRYGHTVALDGLDLQVDRGEVYGFLGPNGAGKTTTIRLLLDLIRPTEGKVEVLGLDPRTAGPDLRHRIGYLADDFVVDGRQTSGELLTYLANLRGGVPASRIDALSERLGLDRTKRIKSLSRGNRQKVGVVQAFMHEPELLILDEPTSGLDPFLQQEFALLVREAVSGGATVFMSSHVMGEVQRIAHRVGIVRMGRLVAVDDVEELRHRSRRRIELVFADAVRAGSFDSIPGVSDVTIEGRTLRCHLDGEADQLIKEASRHRVITMTAEEPDLEEIFFHLFDGDAGGDDAS